MGPRVSHMNKLKTSHELLSIRQNHCPKPLSCSEDGMDQSKWALPRHRLFQTSKEGSVHVRPRMKLHAVWLHGVSLNLYLVHPGVPADSSLVVEAFLRAMQDASLMFQQRQREMPREVLIHAPWMHKIVPYTDSVGQYMF